MSEYLGFKEIVLSDDELTKIYQREPEYYCMKPVSEGGLGLQEVLTKLGVPYE